MTRANVELDFFGMEKDTSSSISQFKKFLDRSRSFREMQGTISKINPEIIKSVIASENMNRTDNSNKYLYSSSKKSKVEDQAGFIRSLPAVEMEKVSQTAPMTIFYNGKVTIVDVTLDKAECILKLALEGNAKKGEWTDMSDSTPTNKVKLLGTLNEDLPIARRKSLKRFLEKRKDRLTWESPYCCPT